jgi:hypothetical protein
MKVPVIQGIIDRRILVNFQVDAASLRKTQRIESPSSGLQAGSRKKAFIFHVAIPLHASTHWLAVGSFLERITPRVSMFMKKRASTRLP